MHILTRSRSTADIRNAESNDRFYKRDRGLARHRPLPDSRREDPMLRPNPPIAMGVGVGRRVLQQGHQDAKRSGIDMWGSGNVLGLLAVAAAAIIYAWGSVHARPLLAVYSSDFVAGSTTFLGGTALVLTSLVFEPGSTAALSGNWGWPALAGWMFLVLFGSVVGYTLFMRLLRDIGASRAGAFAFVSPVIAVLLGIFTYGEKVEIHRIRRHGGNALRSLSRAAGAARFEITTTTSRDHSAY